MSLSYRIKMGVALGCAIGGAWLGYRAWTTPWAAHQIPDFDILGVTWIFANLPLLFLRGMSLLLGALAIGIVISATVRRLLS